jgi:hypothetical protein
MWGRRGIMPISMAIGDGLVRSVRSVKAWRVLVVLRSSTAKVAVVWEHISRAGCGDTLAIFRLCRRRSGTG